MADIRAKIDELIEESYLATLPDEKIRQNALQFLEMCERSIKEARTGKKCEELLRRLETYKALALRVEHAPELADEQERWAAWSPHDLLAHRVARLKLLVLEAIREVDGELADHIERQRFPNPPREPALAKLPQRLVLLSEPRSAPETTALIRLAYALLAGVTLFIIAYRLLH